MKFELTFKVVLLFSYQGFKLSFFHESFYILSHHFILVKNFFKKQLFHLFFEDFVFCDANFYILTHDF